jgi:serine/threonine-protein kinase RsbW
MKRRGEGSARELFAATAVDESGRLPYNVFVTFKGRGLDQLPIVQLQLPGELDYRELVTRTVSLACKIATSARPHTSPEFTNELVSAVGEAFNNIAIHGFRDSEAQQVTILVELEDTHVRVELRDNGQSFQPEAVAVPDMDSLPESGMGLFIIRSFVDKMEYKAGSPNVLALTKFIDRSPSAQDDSPGNHARGNRPRSNRPQGKAG